MRKSVGLLLLVLFACEYEPVNPQLSGIPGISVRNGRLAFESLQFFAGVVNSLSSKSDKELMLWESRLADFTSLRSHQSAGGSDHPRGLLSVANSDGVYQVGDKVILMSGETEFILQTSDEERIKSFVLNHGNVEGVTIHKIRRETFVPTKTEGDQLAGLGADYQLEIIKYCYNYPSNCTGIPPSDIRKFVFESYAYEYALTIAIGVRQKLERRQVYFAPPSCFLYLNWAPGPETMHKRMTSVKFSGFAYNPTFNPWESIPATVEATSNSALEIVQFVAANCIDNFRIYGTLLMDTNGQNYCPVTSYQVGGPTVELWSNISFCRSGYTIPGGGGGGGGGEGGGEDPPPQNCENGCVWGGFECVCP